MHSNTNVTKLNMCHILNSLYSPHSQAKPDSRYKEEYDLIQRNGFINMEFHNNNLSSPQK